jgi:hypothetical protein
VPLPCKCWQKALFIAACKLGSWTNQNQAQGESEYRSRVLRALLRPPPFLSLLVGSLAHYPSLSVYKWVCVCVFSWYWEVIYGHGCVLGCELELFGESVSTGGEFWSDGSRDMRVLKALHHQPCAYFLIYCCRNKFLVWTVMKDADARAYVPLAKAMYVDDVLFSLLVLVHQLFTTFSEAQPPSSISTKI